MATSNLRLFDYESTSSRRPRKRVGLWIAIALILTGAPFLAWRHWPGTNAPWTYPEKVGVFSALRDVRLAIMQYTDKNGRLPESLEIIRPGLPNRVGQTGCVSAEQILSSVILIPADDAKTKRLAGEGRFLVGVYMLRSGPMNLDAAAIISESSNSYDGLYFDDDIVLSFGTEQLAQFKQSAFKLP